MKLIHEDGRPVLIGQSLNSPGVADTKAFKIEEIVEPTPDNPKGFIKGNRVNDSWQQYYPFIFGMRWVLHWCDKCQDTGTHRVFDDEGAEMILEECCDCVTGSTRLIKEGKCNE